jgi:hypothetical protein
MLIQNCIIITLIRLEQKHYTNTTKHQNTANIMTAVDFKDTRMNNLHRHMENAVKFHVAMNKNSGNSIGKNTNHYAFFTDAKKDWWEKFCYGR